MPIRQEQFSGKVVGVVDGDTLSVLRDGKAVKVRLHGTDKPEKAQPFGTRARQFTGELVFGQTVTVRVHDTDRYGRLVGEVLLPDGRSLNHELETEARAAKRTPRRRGRGDGRGDG